MKKFKNLVIGGIQQKVFNLVLVTILLLIAAYTAVIVYQSSSLKKLTAETNLRQKEAIAEISETTMDAVVADSLTSKAEMAAMLADDLFVRLSSTVQILADNAENLLQTPELYSARPFALPDASMEGKISLQLVGETNRMPEDPAVLEKLSLLANLSDVMTALYRNADFLPGEGCAVHKSLTAYVASDRKVKASRENCYTLIPCGAILQGNEKTLIKYSKSAIEYLLSKQS